MASGFDAEEAAKWLRQSEDDQQRAENDDALRNGLREITKSLVAFREELLAEHFSREEAFQLTRDYFGLLLDAGFGDTTEED